MHFVNHIGAASNYYFHYRLQLFPQSVNRFQVHYLLYFKYSSGEGIRKSCTSWFVKNFIILETVGLRCQRGTDILPDVCSLCFFCCFCFSVFL